MTAAIIPHGEFVFNIVPMAIYVLLCATYSLVADATLLGIPYRLTRVTTLSAIQVNIVVKTKEVHIGLPNRCTLTFFKVEHNPSPAWHDAVDSLTCRPEVGNPMNHRVVIPTNTFCISLPRDDIACA